MFFKRKADPRPLGVPLDQLALGLERTTLKCSRRERELRVQHEHFETVLDVVPGIAGGIDPLTGVVDPAPIQAVVRVRTILPPSISAFLKEPRELGAANQFASTGAITADGTTRYVGSRLSIFAGDFEAAWPLHASLLLNSVIASTDAILGALRRVMTDEEPVNTPSVWRPTDFASAQQVLSKVCACFEGDEGLTAEFALEPQAVAAILGHATALWEMSARAHPEQGGGLAFRLRMPHMFPDEGAVSDAAYRLNQLEMEPRSLPPHFGAWASGPNSSLMYCGFLLNLLHDHAGLAINLSIWARERAMWASSWLTGVGIKAR